MSEWKEAREREKQYWEQNVRGALSCLDALIDELRPGDGLFVSSRSGVRIVQQIFRITRVEAAKNSDFTIRHASPYTSMFRRQLAVPRLEGIFLGGRRLEWLKNSDEPPLHIGALEDDGRTGRCIAYLQIDRGRILLGDELELTAGLLGMTRALGQESFESVEELQRRLDACHYDSAGVAARLRPGEARVLLRDGRL